MNLLIDKKEKVSIFFEYGFFQDKNNQWFSSKSKIKISTKNYGLIQFQGNFIDKCYLDVTYNNDSFRITSNNFYIFIDPEKNNQISFKFSKNLSLRIDPRKLSYQVKNIKFTKLDKIYSTILAKKNVHNNSINKLISDIHPGWFKLNVKNHNDEKLFLNGFILKPLENQNDFDLYLDDNKIKTVRYNLSNKDYPYFGDIFFEGWINYPRKKISIITLRNKGKKPDNQNFIWYWKKDRSKNIAPLPNQMRIGSDSVDWFLLSGNTFITKLLNLYKNYNNISNSIVLDWGCGCSRLTRHLRDYNFKEIHGADIDKKNIAWSKNNFKDIKYQLINPSKNKTTYKKNKFDLIVGHSVFTHLNEKDQFLWLIELHRILKTNGIAAVTILGKISRIMEPLKKAEENFLIKNGFYDQGWQNDNVDKEKKGYYRRVYHTYEYILRYWSSFFKIESIIDGFSDHQTMVLMRKK